VTRELVTDLPVQLAASGFLADALQRPGEIIGAGELPERLGAPIDRADPAVTSVLQQVDQMLELGQVRADQRDPRPGSGPF
jgi:hypothetical protein